MRNQWLSNVRKSLVRKKTRNSRRRNRKQSLEFRSLEPRNLLASVSFNADPAEPALFFDADTGQADIVTVSSTTEGALQIQVGGGDSIELAEDLVENTDFVLSQSEVANDTLTINDASSFISFLFFNLGDLNDSFTACLLYTSPSPRDATLSRMPSSA